MYGWGHGYSFTSNVGHLRSNMVGLLAYDGMRTSKALDVRICIFALFLEQHVLKL
jgi:hypothetical protein